MLLNIDKKTNLLVDIGDREVTPELIAKLRKKLGVGNPLSNLDRYQAELQGQINREKVK